MKTRTYRPASLNMRRLANMLARGELVALPTETVYGLAADALDAHACKRIFKAKGRPSNDPLIVHVNSTGQAGELAEWSRAAEKLAKKFWPGPLTLVLPKKKVVPDLVTAGLPSVALRMPANKFFREMIRLSGRVLAAPSANPFAYVSPTTAAHVREGLDGRIPAILDGGPCEVGLESTIVDLRNEKAPVLLRQGRVSRKEIEKILGCPLRVKQNSGGGTKAALAPGMLLKHYSPRSPLVLVDDLKKAFAMRKPNQVFLFFRKPEKEEKGVTFFLSRKGDIEEAAHNLFGVLRHLDGMKPERIFAEKAPGSDGLAAAINDRLTRAAA